MAEANRGPLTERDLEEMNERLAQLADAEEVIRRAQNAGLDFSEPAKQLKDLRAQITKLKGSFFPGR